MLLCAINIKTNVLVKSPYGPIGLHLGSSTCYKKNFGLKRATSTVGTVG